MRQLVGAAPHRQSRGGGVTFGVSVLTQQINNSSESADRLRQLLHAWRFVITVAGDQKATI